MSQFEISNFRFLNSHGPKYSIVTVPFQELIEAVVLPMTHKDRFINLGIHPPKGVLLYGPPGILQYENKTLHLSKYTVIVGTGKTMMARAVAAQTKSTFLKLAGPQLVQMFIGDGAKLVSRQTHLLE